MHHAPGRLTVFDQRDVDRELAVAVDEFAGTVQRIDQEEGTTGNVGNAACRHRFLGHDRNVTGNLGQALQDDFLRPFVGIGHRGLVILHPGRDLALVDFQDRQTGLDGNIDQAVDQRLPVGHASALRGHAQRPPATSMNDPVT